MRAAAVAVVLCVLACAEADKPLILADGGTLALDAGLSADAAASADAAPADAEAADALLAPDAGPEDSGQAADGGRAPSAGPLLRLRAAAGELAAMSLDEVGLDPGGALILGTGYAASDPYGAGGYQGGNYYNGGSYRYGVAISPVLEWARPFDQVVPSFEADTPAGTWVALKLRARVAGRWTKDYVLGVWAFEEDSVRRHSVDGQMDSDGDVLTDTLALSASADALQLVVVLATEGSATPRVRALAASAIDTAAAPRPDPGEPGAWGTTLAVPGRSQMIYPNGGEVWCSPTSTAMILAYWSAVLGEPALLELVPSAAALTFDWIYGGNGNWPFNTAHAAALAGGRLQGFVTRLDSFAQLERLIAAGVPAAISVSYRAGELGGSPIRSTAGHLLVVTGFAANGDVVANDPAFDSDATVGVTYDRQELERAWLHSQRTAYVIYPREQSLPIDPLGAYY